MQADVEPPPSASSGDSITLSASSEYPCYSPDGEQLCWAVTSFKAPFYEPSSRAPVDIVAVIDKSGSMDGVKLDLVKKTLLFVVDQLKDCDRISLVTYDTNVELVFGLMKMESHNKERAKTFVKSIRSGSSTNLCGGLLKGMEQIALTCGGEKAQVQSVLLLTDGLANCWITQKNGIIAEMKKMQELGLGAVTVPPNEGYDSQMFIPPQQIPPKQTKKKIRFFQPKIKQPQPIMQQQQQQMVQQQVVPQQNLAIDPDPRPAAAATPIDPTTSKNKFNGTVYTFGFGSDHDSSLLEAISTQGGGVYYYIDSNDKIPESFADCLGGLLSVVGQNISLKLSTIGKYSFKTVHTKRAINWSLPNKSCEISMGDLQSEEERDIVVELLMPALSGPVEDDPIISTQLSYFNVITSQLETVDCQLAINRKDGDAGPRNIKVDIQRNRILATLAIDEAEALADKGKLAEAQGILKTAISNSKSSASGDQSFCKVLISDLNKCLDGIQSHQTYSSHGKLYMKNRVQSHSVQRSNYIDDDDVCSYTSQSKVMFLGKLKK